jgi:hypothetical protein
MAATFTAAAFKPVDYMGSTRVVCGVLTMTDGATTCNIGLSTCYGGSVTPRTAATASWNWQALASGPIKIVSCNSGDTFNVIAFGN